MRLPPPFRIPDRRASCCSGALLLPRRSAKGPRSGAREGQECSSSNPLPRPDPRQQPEQPRCARPHPAAAPAPSPRRLLRLPSARSSHDSRLRAHRRALRGRDKTPRTPRRPAGAKASLIGSERAVPRNSRVLNPLFSRVFLPLKSRVFFRRHRSRSAGSLPPPLFPLCSGRKAFRTEARPRTKRSPSKNEGIASTKIEVVLPSFFVVIYLPSILEYISSSKFEGISPRRASVS